MNAGPKPFRRGLVVGKFSPLHRGHMHVIQAAIDACAEVVVISYTDPVFARCGRAAREDWIAGLFPQVRRLVIDDASLRALCSQQGIDQLMPLPSNDAAEATHREFTAWLCWAVCGVAVDAVFTSEDYGDGFALALSEYFSARMAQPTQVRHVCVDRARQALPISGTAIRTDPHAHRRFLDPSVYASFVDRVCVLGGESSGKTTLVEALAQRLETVAVPEVGRQRWEEKGGALNFDDMRAIAEAQVSLEDALARNAHRWLVCDGSALTTAFYSEDGFGTVDPVVSRLAALPYAFTFVCAPDFPFVQDGTRRDAAFRQRQHQWYLDVLDKTGVAYTVLEGTTADRVSAAVSILG